DRRKILARVYFFVADISWAHTGGGGANGASSTFPREALVNSCCERTSSALAAAQVVGASGFESRPLGYRASARPLWLPSGRAAASARVGALLWPVGGRVLPLLLSPVDGQIEQVIAVIHHLDASRSGPVSLEDLGSLPQVAHDMHSAYSASNQEGLERT